MSGAGYNYDAFDAQLHSIFRQTQGDAWFKPSEENISAGVAIRVEGQNYRVFPYENPHLVPFEAAIRALNPVVAVKTRSAAVHAALNSLVNENGVYIYLDSNTRIQVLETMSLLPAADKEQCAAFISDEKVLIVWSDDMDTIIPLCHELEEKLIKLVWRSRTRTVASTSSFNNTPSSSIIGSGSIGVLAPAPSTLSFYGAPVNLPVSPAPTYNGVGKTSSSLDEKTSAEVAVSPAEPLTQRDMAPPKKASRFNWSWTVKDTPAPVPADAEKGVLVKEARPIRLFAPFYGGLGAALSVFFIGSGLNILLSEAKQDNNFTRLALLGFAPFLLCVSLFFALQVVTNISFVIGPVQQYHENSRYYSAIKPAANPAVDNKLPHISIELPVYKESLEQTIAPSVISLKKAMQTYARQGGTSSIFVHDDGLQLLSPELRDERIEFYSNHAIGWVARPGHSSAPDGFKRAGRFKKASNMNYSLEVSLKMEKHILALEAAGEDDVDSEGVFLEDRALALAVEEMFAETGNKEGHKPWACNGRSLRLGSIILICDSDTIVPTDCFRDAAREFEECPEVAVIQHESDVMQVAHHYFENGIAHFTRRINKCISMGCANGEVAPFVGHNAFLRWSAVQDAAFIDPADGKKKMWSESNVSEDFDMALRLQLRGYIIRWVTYSLGGFKEGVSLSVDDELNRWQKYSYGCNELIFNPMKDWWRMAPITKQLRTFIWSPAPLHYKITMMSYMFSYYGIAAGAILSLANYFILGWELEDGFYMHSFEIWLACCIVFPVAGNVGFTLLEYRLGLRSIASAALENITWIPFFFFFFGGLSIHLSIALLAHLFSYNITWGATIKEVERSNFFIEVPRILKRFWLAFAICFTVVVGVIILMTPLVPMEWKIASSSWSVILPLMIVAICHILFPIVLNPYLLMFSF